MEQHADKTLIASLDENRYLESELISIKVPAAHLSAYVNSKEFERVDGQVELQGVQYNYVKRRFINDSLELLCIPNKKATELKTAKNDFFQLVNDLQHPGQSKKADQHTSFKCFNGEYYAGQHSFSLQDPGFLLLKAAADRYLCQPLSAIHSIAGQPPDRA
jgi:hypothetical protein